jgi:hypothetical protein
MSRRTSSLGPGSGTASRSPDRRGPRRRCGSVAMSYSKIVHRMTSCGDQGAQPARLNATVPTAFIPPGNIAAASRRICSRQTRPRGPTPPSSRYRTTDQPTRQTGGSQPKRRNGLEPDADHERSVNVLQMVACSRGSSSGSTLEPGSGSAGGGALLCPTMRQLRGRVRPLRRAGRFLDRIVRTAGVDSR